MYIATTYKKFVTKLTVSSEIDKWRSEVVMHIVKDGEAMRGAFVYVTNANDGLMLATLKCRRTIKHEQPEVIYAVVAALCYGAAVAETLEEWNELADHLFSLHPNDDEKWLKEARRIRDELKPDQPLDWVTAVLLAVHDVLSHPN